MKERDASRHVHACRHWPWHGAAVDLVELHLGLSGHGCCYCRPLGRRRSRDGRNEGNRMSAAPLEGG
eukprot:5514969-Pyramimonas_sp.AAC.1